jgi:MFS family permease
MFFMLFSGMFMSVFVLSVFKTLAIDINDSLLTLGGSIAQICNGGSRVVWGQIMDKYGFTRVYLSLLLI